MFFFHDQYIPHIWELYFIYRLYCLTLFLFYMFIRNQMKICQHYYYSYIFSEITCKFINYKAFSVLKFAENFALKTSMTNINYFFWLAFLRGHH